MNILDMSLTFFVSNFDIVNLDKENADAEFNKIFIRKTLKEKLEKEEKTLLRLK